MSNICDRAEIKLDRVQWIKTVQTLWCSIIPNFQDIVKQRALGLSACFPLFYIVLERRV